MTEEAIYKLLLAIMFLVSTILGVWPQLMANNIFKKNPSQKYSDLIQAGPMSEPRSGKNEKFQYLHFLILMVIVCLTGIYLKLFDNAEASPIFFFAFVILMMGNAGLYFFKDKTYVNYPEVRYAVRSWFSSVLIAPLIITLIILFRNIHNFNTQFLLDTYKFILFTGFGYSAPVFGILAIAAYRINKHHWTLKQKRYLILILAELLLGCTVFFLLVSAHMLSDCYTLWPPYAITIGLALMYYKLPPSPFNEPDDESSAIADTTEITTTP
ncbi:hypothetical protein [Mucilaginibacter paludis]|uniref:Uncharacterized protein n=1 Tax=Mucilaginibacter paludis DSM 18603 TaxID=714943 RepID=H1XZZ1_9SPHI|nr:hypothetical protein [Mucilaginibacter paludis]EHQ27833.1 hypothetical protein Mucpa_3735 [Mucilaginibacter paludis DSM 18603]